MLHDPVNRRYFFMSAASATTALAAKPAPGRVIGANDRINVAVIGAGGRGFYVAGQFVKNNNEANGNCQIVGACDVYQKRVTRAKDAFKCEGTLDYKQILERNDVDAVIVATPDHWHAPIAIEAMQKGKDVYLEKPMCHTVDEARRLTETVKATGRVLQVGSQTTSGKQWAAAREVISTGKLGKLIMSQGSYHRNSVDGEWNWPIDPEAGPDGKGENFIDWKQFLGPAQKRDWAKDNGAERFFRFRKFWDYSGGIATDLYYHVVAPMNICWGEPQFPYKVMAGGGQYAGWQNDIREVPDTFHLIGEYKKGHSLVLSSSMGNSQHIPGLIRGHAATLIMVQSGRFEGPSAALKLIAESRMQNGKRTYISPEMEDLFKGQAEIDVPVEEQSFAQIMQNHVGNFLSCMRTRQKPQLDVETGARAQVLITMAVQSYRQGKVLYFDEKNWKIVDKAPVA
ncbi:MAG: Gfo/Idh/MocA family oxidoreductase [Bryobacter sp.]|nr:Gfo/Idh/MocA family oxidoreductase [Bryobacter sp.]